jgi:hypothetical protein
MKNCLLKSHSKKKKNIEAAVKYLITPYNGLAGTQGMKTQT